MMTMGASNNRSYPRSGATLGVLGQALVDIIYSVSSEHTTALELKPDSHQHITAKKSAEARELLRDLPHSIASGGSAINSLVAYQLMGGSTCAFFRTGADHFAEFYENDLRGLGIRLFTAKDSSLPTGHSLILSDPARGRAMATCLGAANVFWQREVSDDFYTTCDALLLEGYMLAIEGSEFIDSFSAAHRAGKRTICTISAPWIASRERQKLMRALSLSSVAIANEEEAAALTGFKDPVENVKAIARLLPRGAHEPLVVITAGARGAYFGSSERASHVAAVETEVKDVTGAGDAFAGAFLFSLLSGKDPALAAAGAAYLASGVISQVGARTTPELAARWKERFGHS